MRFMVTHLPGAKDARAHLVRDGDSQLGVTLPPELSAPQLYHLLAHAHHPEEEDAGFDLRAD